ncbi:Ser-Thr-rich glycosyl-phosphatidyl-inositol-anchored membrane family-domain-containing protein [Xylaria flabelliformis]|nr:Ser-Thr-rich glycosyl-phosphatidyl-inositol-anchored membrane family-domain-containing protein [Xylaria flabelliformis]
MKVVISSVVLAAFLGLVNAKVQLTNSNYDDIEAGSTFTITWSGAEGPVTLTLKNGESGDLKTVQTITTNASGDSFVWPVNASLPTGDYALEIDDGSDTNYSKMFPIDGTVAATTSSSSSSTAASSSSTVSATSSTATPSTTSSSASSSSTASSSSSASTSTGITSSATTSSSSTASHSTLTRTTSSAATSTSAPSQTSVPNTNDAHNMAASIIPGILAMLGAALF